MEHQTSHSPSPWLAIWIRPRATIRTIISSDPTRHVLLLGAIGGIVQVLNQSSSRNAGDVFSLPVILLICATVGPIVGVVLLYLVGALYSWVGGWLGGQASPVKTRAAYAWSWVPTICAHILWIPQFAIFGTELFTTATPRIEANPLLALLLLASLGIQLPFVIWAFIVQVICLSEVHAFSIWRALATILLSATILFVPIFCILVLASGLTISP